MQPAEMHIAEEGRTQTRVSFARLLMRALGVSFLSLISLGLALFAYGYLPQVQDLFLDVRPYWHQGVIYWFWFYIIAMTFWALPLVFTARLLLLQNYQDIGVDSPTRYRIIVDVLPRMFVIAAFYIVLLGIILAASNLPLDTGISEAEKELRSYLTRHILVLFAFTALFALLVLYRGAVVRSYFRFMKGFEERRPGLFRALLIAFEKLASRQRRDLDRMSFYLEELKPAFLDLETYIASQRAKVFMILYLIVTASITVFLIALHFMSYSELIASWFAALSMEGWPEWAQGTVRWFTDTLWIQRAALLPMLFGAWLPFMAFLALLSNRHHFPFILTLIAIAVGLTLFISDGHDARIRKVADAAEEAAQAPENLTLARAVELWKKHNGWAEKGCDSDTSSRDHCPRPIIVAGEGGGSRAAFFIASVLGELQDRSVHYGEEKGRGRVLRPFSNQLFAISSVSGSSAGAAFFTGALRHHPGTPTRQIVESLYGHRLWFRNIAYPNRDFLHDHVTYKDALQAAFSVDFLSPMLVGYLARDVTTFSRLPYVLDRAGVVETTWEATFDQIYGRRGSESLLEAPFLNFRPTEERWEPILLFNATSIETGRRVIITPLSASDRSNGTKFLFPEAYDLYELICVERRYEDLSRLDRIASFLPRIFSPLAGVECRNGKPVGLDVRLSTAANLSARFPVATPHANIRDRLGNVSDSLVDGAYFDNSGAVTAFELASALKSLDPKLDPFVIQVSSEPEWFPDRCVSPKEARGGAMRPTLPDEADFKLLGTLGNITTVNATRIARGYQTIQELPERMHALNGKDSHELIFVCPQERENIIAKFFRGEVMTRAASEQPAAQAWKNVSLSWWLSPPLQAYLDAQLHSPRNQRTMDRILGLLEERGQENRPATSQ